jgi:hypothetical protein
MDFLAAVRLVYFAALLVQLKWTRAAAVSNTLIDLSGSYSEIIFEFEE